MSHGLARGRSGSLKELPRTKRTPTKDKQPSTGDKKNAAKSPDVAEGGDVSDDEFNPVTASPLQRSGSCRMHDRQKSKDAQDVKTCPICMDRIKHSKKLNCGHEFCDDCIQEAFKHAQKCPICEQIFGKLRGNQPAGATMNIQRSRDDLAGSSGAGSLIITYEIPSGFQQANHPNPGRPFKGTRRTAYLPNNMEGQEVCDLLREAFDAGLMFTIGRSNTTGEDNVVIWNDIHHKTSKTGTYGYPDYTYLSRVKKELAAKGIGVPPAAAATATTVSHDYTSSGQKSTSSDIVSSHSRPATTSTATTTTSFSNYARSSNIYTSSSHSKYTTAHTPSLPTYTDTGDKFYHSSLHTDHTTSKQTTSQVGTGTKSLSGSSHGTNRHGTGRYDSRYDDDLNKHGVDYSLSNSRGYDPHFTVTSRPIIATTSSMSQHKSSHGSGHDITGGSRPASASYYRDASQPYDPRDYQRTSYMNHVSTGSSYTSSHHTGSSSLHSRDFASLPSSVNSSAPGRHRTDGKKAW
jgi:deltex-like protein